MAGFASAAVLIGASTGGPPVIERIVRALPASFPAPVAICQHITQGFVGQWAERLDPLCWLRVKEAENGEPFVRGNVYIAPVGFQMRFRKDGRGAKVRLEPDTADSQFVPSIDELLSSGAEAFGGRALGVVLTGLGSDGAKGLLALRRAGAYTIAEKPETAVARSMPESAAKLGAVLETVCAEDIGRVIVARANGVFS